MPNTKAGRIFLENAVAIYKWIEENKPKLKRGVTSSSLFSGVVKNSVDEAYFPANIRVDDPAYDTYVRLIARMRARGLMKFRLDPATNHKVWSVNETMLPTGAVTYTGVRTSIPLEAPTLEAQKQHTETEVRKAEAFLDQELRNIHIPYVILRRKGMVIEANDQSLYAIFKIGQVLNEVTEVEDEQTGTLQQDEPAPDLDEAEGESADEQTIETASPF